MGRHRAKRTAEVSAVDLTPMIDVVFQLIIFFVVTANLQQESVLKHIVLPMAPHSKKHEKHPSQITLQVDARGRFYVGKSSPLRLSRIRGLLRNAVRIAGNHHIPVLIRGDGDARHKGVRKLMDVCAGEGLYRLSFATMQQRGDD